jgi:hypothetical protein
MAQMTGFKVFKGTKESFIQKGLNTTHANAIVYITGGAGNEANSCIFAQGTYFASISQMMDAIKYVKGINVGGTSYDVQAGGGYIAFNAADPATVAVNANQNGISIGLTSTFVKKVDDVVALVSTINSDYLKASDKKELNDAIKELSNNVQNNGDDIRDLKELVGSGKTLATTAKNTIEAINEVKGLANTAQSAAEGAQGTANEALTAAGTAKTESVVTVTTKSDANYAQSYEIKQNGAVVGTINIPKDMVVKSGEIVDNPSGQPTGKYIKLTLQNQDTPIYINVADLVDVYTAKASAAQVQLAISNTNEISATIVAGSISSTELKDNAVVTSKIADGTITDAKLNNAYKTAIATAMSQAAAAAPQATTYTKTEVDNLIGGITGANGTLANFYNKSEIDTKFSGYYTKSEVDAMWAWEELS